MTATLAAPPPALKDIESIYQGDAGDQYRQRTRNAKLDRSAFWRMIIERTHPTSILEVGAGTDVNARHFPADIAYTALDISHRALTELEGRRVQASAAALPVADRAYDLVVSAGLAIHLPEHSISPVFQELARVSRKYVLLAEYEDVKRREIPWRGMRDVLWADSFGLKFWIGNPQFAPILRRELLKPDGFDRTTASLWARREGNQ